MSKNAKIEKNNNKPIDKDLLKEQYKEYLKELKEFIKLGKIKGKEILVQIW